MIAGQVTPHCMYDDTSCNRHVLRVSVTALLFACFENCFLIRHCGVLSYGIEQFSLSSAAAVFNMSLFCVCKAFFSILFVGVLATCNNI